MKRYIFAVLGGCRSGRGNQQSAAIIASTPFNNITMTCFGAGYIYRAAHRAVQRCRRYLHDDDNVPLSCSERLVLRTFPVSINKRDGRSKHNIRSTEHGARSAGQHRGKSSQRQQRSYSKHRHYHSELHGIFYTERCNSGRENTYGFHSNSTVIVAMYLAF